MLLTSNCRLAPNDQYSLWSFHWSLNELVHRLESPDPVFFGSLIRDKEQLFPTCHLRTFPSNGSSNLILLSPIIKKGEKSECKEDN